MNVEDLNLSEDSFSAETTREFEPRKSYYSQRHEHVATNSSALIETTTTAAATEYSNLEWENIDYIEIVYLSIIILAGTVLNTVVLSRFLLKKRTNGSTGPHNRNTFNLFKINLTITDFAILLIHALGKVIWILTYEWKFGDYGCRLYQFLSAFSYYSNSNVVVAIGIDRLKVVYTSHKGGASARRVKNLLIAAWSIAAICSLPQLFVWTGHTLKSNWFQCTTVWQIATHENRITPTQQNFQQLYEIFHQAVVFWIPFFSLFISYVFIVVRVIRHTLQPKRLPLSNYLPKFMSCCHKQQSDCQCSALNDDSKDTKLTFANRAKLFKKWASTNSSNKREIYKKKINFRLFQSLQKVEDDVVENSSADEIILPRRVVIADKMPITNEGSIYEQKELLLGHNNKSRDECGRPQQHSDSNFERPTRFAQNVVVKLGKNGTETMQLSIGSYSSTTRSSEPSIHSNGNAREVSTSSSNFSEPLVRNSIINGEIRTSRCSLCGYGYSATIDKSNNSYQTMRAKQNGFQWHKQVRSRVFVTSLLIVSMHCAFWLPYNLLNTLRFLNENLFNKIVDNGGLLVEDLIVLNSLVNPILYGYDQR